MTFNRRSFMKGLAATGLLPAFSSLAPSVLATPTALRDSHQPLLKPKRLSSGDTVMLVAPATVEYNKLSLTLAVESLEALGLKVKIAPNVMTRYGYFPASDEDRAGDINMAFIDEAVSAVIALKGGWGSARTLPYLNYDAIAANPKILLGYSDITALLNGLNHKTGLVTFHGPNGGSAWSQFSADNVRDILFNGSAQTMINPADKGEYLTNRSNRTQTIVGGKAEGHVVGGNLTVLTAIQGTPYFPNVKGKILLLEDIGENIYRVDRMLTQLALGGILNDAAGVIFGGFTDVNAGRGLGNFSLMDIFEQHMTRANKPSFYGAMFGHIKDKRTMAIGTKMAFDADAGTITMLESAVL